MCQLMCDHSWDIDSSRLGISHWIMQQSRFSIQVNNFEKVYFFVTIFKCDLISESIFTLVSSSKNLPNHYPQPFQAYLNLVKKVEISNLAPFLLGWEPQWRNCHLRLSQLYHNFLTGIMLLCTTYQAISQFLFFLW